MLMFQSQIVSHKSEDKGSTSRAIGSVEKKVGTEPTAFSPLQPLKGFVIYLSESLFQAFPLCFIGHATADHIVC